LTESDNYFCNCDNKNFLYFKCDEDKKTYLSCKIPKQEENNIFWKEVLRKQCKIIVIIRGELESVNKLNTIFFEYLKLNK